jgi:hypothetical protein
MNNNEKGSEELKFIFAAGGRKVYISAKGRLVVSLVFLLAFLGLLCIAGYVWTNNEKAMNIQIPGKLSFPSSNYRI